MKQTFTQNDLIRFVYKEVSTVEKLAIEDELAKNWTLNEQYEEILSAYTRLPKALFSPSASCIQNILKYSSQSTVGV